MPRSMAGIHIELSIFENGIVPLTVSKGFSNMFVADVMIETNKSNGNKTFLIILKWFI